MSFQPLFVYVCLSVCLLIDPIVFTHLSRVCGTPSRLTMTCCRMRKGSVLSAGPPVTCLPSPVPVAPSSWSVSTTSRTSALALLAATHSSECLQKPVFHGFKTKGKSFKIFALKISQVSDK